MLVGGQKSILVLLGMLSLCMAVRADMVPLSATEGSYRPSLLCLSTDSQPVSSCRPGIDSAWVTDWDALPIGSLLDPIKEAGQTSETKPAQILSDRQNSLSLFLYALLGLGLCRSAPFVKKLHFGAIPDWYHTGGPYQIGHSFALSPDCLSLAPVYGLFQPVCILSVEDSSPRYRRGLMVSLWRKSQYTPAVLASRGPPRTA